MANTGNVFVGTGESVDKGLGESTWGTPGNIVSDNGSDATITSGSSGSDYLVGRNCGFSIPTGATINGVLVRVEASESAGGSEALLAQLQDATAALVGTNKTNTNEGNITGTAKAVYTFGSTSDVWGASLTPAIVNDPDFGVRLWFATSHTMQIDYVTIAIEYTETTPIGDAAFSLPIVTLSATASSTVVGASGVMLPVITTAGAGSSTVVGSSSATVPMLSLGASGTVGNAAEGNASLSMPVPTLGALASSFITGTASLTMPVISLAASGSSVLTVLGAMSVPLLALAATSSSLIAGLAALALPILTLAGTASEPSAGGSGSVLSSNIHPTWLRVLIPLLLLPSLMELF
jgi:hypothetical protein